MLVVFVACGWRYTMAMTGGERVWTCGDNDYGQLGHDRTCKHLLTLLDPGQ